MNIQRSTLKKIPFDIVIPNLDGDGIAETIQIDVEAYIDPETGEDVLTPESLEMIERTQARHMGLMTAEEVRSLREKRLKLTQQEMSELLQIGAKTYTRWESGRARPSRSMNVLLRAIDDGQIDVTYLRSLRDPLAREEWQRRRHPRHVFLAASHSEHDHQLGFQLPTTSAAVGPSSAVALWHHIDEWQVFQEIEASPKKCFYTVIASYDELSQHVASGEALIPKQREQRYNSPGAVRFDLSLINEPLQKGA